MRRLFQFGSKKHGAKAPVKPSTSSSVAAPAVSLPAQATGAVLQGVQVVCEGTDPVVDIVAVHGLNGHCEKTWTAGNSIDSVNWLRDLLPHDLPNARILSWGYDANTHSGSRVSCQYLFDHARTLVSDLCLERQITETSKRPIIFVAHSLGGIIVKSALIHSDAARRGALEEHRAIKLSTYGILFMGTPHQGGSGVALGKLIVNVASVFMAADDRLLQHLERDSEWLQQQLGQYGPISGDFVTKFAFEEYKTPTMLGKSIMVVPRASAVVPGAADGEAIAIHADHIHMVKFGSKTDPGYRTVSGHLRVMAARAGTSIGGRWDTEAKVDVVQPSIPKKSFTIQSSVPEVLRVEHFVGREENITEVCEALQYDGSRKTAVVHGLGGMGKTQLALAYEKRHRDEYSAVFWVNSKDVDTLKQGYAAAARRIYREHPSLVHLNTVAEGGNLDDAVEAVKQWMSHAQNNRWLVIYDNYDTPKPPGRDDPGTFDIRPFLPEVDHGAILVTSRSSHLELGRPVAVKKLRDINHSLEILSQTSRREGLDTDPDARRLADELDGLPLALATAGAYLHQLSTSFTDYLQLYKASRLRLQQETQLLSSEDLVLCVLTNIPGSLPSPILLRQEDTYEAHQLLSSVRDNWSGRGLHASFVKGESVPLKIGRTLGHGSNGEVVEATCKGVKLALKKIYHRHQIRPEQLREIDIMQNMKHHHVVQLIGTYIQRPYLGLLIWPVARCDLSLMLELLDMRGASIQEHGQVLESSERLLEHHLGIEDFRCIVGQDQERIWTIFGCLTSAMVYLHQNNIRHKDIKPSNILLDRNGLWLTDFGAAKDFTYDLTSTSESRERGTLRYSAPEVANFQESGRSADMFSLGCVFLETLVVLTHTHTLADLEEQRPLKNKTYEANLNRTDQWTALIDPTDTKVQHLLLEIKQMLEFDRARRPTAKALASRLVSIDQHNGGQLSKRLHGSCCGHWPERDLNAEKE